MDTFKKFHVGRGKHPHASHSGVGHRNRRYEMVNIPADKKFPLIDIGVNLVNKIFNLDVDIVVARALNSGVEKMILTANKLHTSDRAIILARRHPRTLYASVGIHPHFVKDEWNDKSKEMLKKLVALPEVVAIGEVGLDFIRNYTVEDSQLEAFEKQVELACEHQKPLLAHERGSHQKFIEVLKKFRGRLPPVVVHCFIGSKSEMMTYIAMGFYIGITGFICKEKHGKQLREDIKECPLDRILLESNAPYMVPNAPITDMDSIGRSLLAQCYGGNEPCTLPIVLQTVAKCLEMDVAEVAKATTENSNRVFNLSRSPVKVEEQPTYTT